MKRLLEKDEGALMEYLMAFELESYMMISNLTAAGLAESDKLRAGEYYNHGGSMLAVYNSGIAYAFLPDDSAIKPFSELLEEKQIKLLTGTPEANVRKLDKSIKKKAERFALSEICAACLSMPNMVERRGYGLQRLYADDREGFEAYARIYNQAQDENAPVEHYMRLADETYGAECFYLGRYEGEPCFTSAAQFQTPSYIILGNAGATPEMKGWKLSSITLYTLAHEMLARGFTPITFANTDNKASFASIKGRSFTVIEDTRWYFVWY